MNHLRRERREVWRAMSNEDKHQRLQSLRLHQQRQVELEMLRLQLYVR